ncbi:MAG: FAD-binding oxidoreductase, partial [Acidimicrobiales bacterium]
MYATDASNYRQVPLGVVLPRHPGDVVAALATCRDFEVPVIPRGAGTSLAGQGCNRAVVIDCSRWMKGVTELDPVGRTARVAPGTVLDQLQLSAGEHGLAFGPDPASHNRATLGGMIGNNACGMHSIGCGRTSDNIAALDVVTYDGVQLRLGRTSETEIETLAAVGGRTGDIYRSLRSLAQRYEGPIRTRYPPIARRVSGYNLDELLNDRGFNLARALVGTEGTCVVVLSAVVSLVPRPAWRALVVLGYPSIVAAADAVPSVMALDPIGLEGMDDVLVGYARHAGVAGADLLPEGSAWLIAEVGGDSFAEAELAARTLAAGAGAATGGGGAWTG